MSRITEKEAVDLAVLGLAKPIKDLAFQLEFSSLAHMVQKCLFDQKKGKWADELPKVIWSHNTS